MGAVFGVIALIIVIAAAVQIRKLASFRKELSTALTSAGFASQSHIISKDARAALGVDTPSKRICFAEAGRAPQVLSFSALAEVAILEDGESVTKTSRTSQAGRALVGGLVLGPVGFLAGALLGKKYAQDKVSRLDVRLLVNNPDAPILNLSMMAAPGAIKKSSLIYRQARRDAERCYATVMACIRTADEMDAHPAPMPAARSASTETPGSSSEEPKSATGTTLLMEKAISAAPLSMKRDRSAVTLAAVGGLAVGGVIAGVWVLGSKESSPVTTAALRTEALAPTSNRSQADIHRSAASPRPARSIDKQMTKVEMTSGVPLPSDAARRAPDPSVGSKTNRFVTQGESVNELATFYQAWMKEHKWSLDLERSQLDPLHGGRLALGYAAVETWCSSTKKRDAVVITVSSGDRIEHPVGDDVYLSIERQHVPECLGR